MKRSTYTRRNIILGVFLLLLLWQIISVKTDRNNMVFPGVSDTFKYALYLLRKSYTYRCILASLGKMLTGFALSFLLALIIGIIAGNNSFTDDLLKPLIVTLRAIPTASLIYLFIVISGYNNAPVLLVMLICFPILYEGIKNGIRNIDNDLIDAARVDGSSIYEENIHIRLPLAVPYIVSAISSSFSLSFKIEIMAEVITGSTRPGLGNALSGARSSDPTNMTVIFAYSFIAVMLMFMIDLMAGFILKRMNSL